MYWALHFHTGKVIVGEENSKIKTLMHFHAASQMHGEESTSIENSMVRLLCSLSVASTTRCLVVEDTVRLNQELTGQGETKS